MCNLDTIPPRRARGTTAGTAAALMSSVLLASGLAAPPVARAQADAEGATSEARPTRDMLGGDWGGARDSLDQHGIRFDLWTAGFTQGMFQGTGDDAWDVGGRADMLIDGDTGRLGLWQGGGIHTHLTYRTGDLPGARGGALLPVHLGGLFPLDSKDELVATSLYISQRFGESTRVMLGKINGIDLLARHPFFGGWGTDRFWNVAFVAPPTGVIPPVIMGGILTYSFAPYSFTAMVFDPNDQTTSYSLNHLFADGVNVSLGLSWSGELAGRRTTAGITATYSTAQGIDFREIGLPPDSDSGTNSTKDGAYNVMVEGSHLLVERESVPGQGLGVYARAAIADGNPNLIQGSFVGGIAGHALVPGRPLDSFGAGYFFYNFSNDLQNALARVRKFRDEQGVEVFYVFVPKPWLRLTADLQWVRPADGANATIFLGGLRARVAF